MDIPPIRIVAIDPGTNSLGFAVLEVMDNCVEVLYADTLHGAKLAAVHTGLLEVHGERVTKLYALNHEIAARLCTWMPHHVVSESPYMGRFPQAYAALIECVGAIRNAVIAYDRQLPLHQLDPATVKQAVGVSGKTGDKTLMTAALKRLHTQIAIMDGTLDDLDEHAIDAIAVGAAFSVQMGYLTLPGGIKDERFRRSKKIRRK